MTLTLTDPRLTLWEQRAAMIGKLGTLRVYRATICGCDRCGDQDKAEEMDALITRAAEAVDEITNRICERKGAPNG